jgi:hypothetical protein
MAKTDEDDARKKVQQEDDAVSIEWPPENSTHFFDEV